MESSLYEADREFAYHQYPSLVLQLRTTLKKIMYTNPLPDGSLLLKCCALWESSEDRSTEKNVTVDVPVKLAWEEVLCLEEEEAD